MPETDLIKLYSGQILALTTDIPHLGELDQPQARVKKRAPLCGSWVSVDLVMEDGRVAAFAQNVKACALGQAAAALLGAQVIGRSLPEIETLHAQLRAMLSAGGPAPDAPFEGFAVLEPARDFTNRHRSIELAVEATLAAAREVLAGPAILSAQ